VRDASTKLEAYSTTYRPLHLEVRDIQREIFDLRDEIAELEQTRQRLKFGETVDATRIDAIEESIAAHETQLKRLETRIPDNWKDARAGFNELASAEKRARQQYRQNVDDSYSVIAMMRKMLAQTDALEALQDRFEPLLQAIETQSAESAMESIEALEDELNKLAETHRIIGKLSQARRALRALEPDVGKAKLDITEAMQRYNDELEWRRRAVTELSGDLEEYNAVIRNTVGIRMQQRLTSDQADSVASCLAVHKDLTLYF